MAKREKHNDDWGGGRGMSESDKLKIIGPGLVPEKPKATVENCLRHMVDQKIEIESLQTENARLSYIRKQQAKIIRGTADISDIAIKWNSAIETIESLQAENAELREELQTAKQEYFEAYEIIEKERNELRAKLEREIGQANELSEILASESLELQERAEEAEAICKTAPTDSGIPELDEFCEKYNKGDFDLWTLIGRIWNYQQAIIEKAEAENERLTAKCEAFSNLLITLRDSVMSITSRDYGYETIRGAILSRIRKFDAERKRIAEDGE